MQTKQMRRGGGVALLPAAGVLTALLTALLTTGAAAARHHAPHHVRHHAHRSARRHVRHTTRVASRGGSNAYGEGVERALAGVHIDDSYRSVLQRFGNPSETQLEEIELVPVAATATSPSTGLGVSPSGGATAVQTTPVKIFVGPSSPEPGAAGGGSGSSSGTGTGLAGALSGAIGALGNGSLFQSMGGFPGSGSSAGGTLIKPEHPEYRWIYDEPNSNSLEFTFTPGGSVIQIRATGYHGFVRTNRGIQLGVKFSQVLLAYGNPEKQNYDGPILSANYTDHNHVGFQFYNQRLVGITVASVE